MHLRTPVFLRTTIVAAFSLCLPLVACGSPDTTSTTGTSAGTHVIDSAAQILAAVSAVPRGAVPDHFENGQTLRLEGDFDVNAFFTALPNLSVEPGWVLDYVYEATDIGGHPVLYARPAGRQAYDSYEAWCAAVGEGELVNGIGVSHADDYLDHIVVADTPQGYFEFAVFHRVSTQFYQMWHAAYNDTRIVCDEQTLEAALEAADSFMNLGLPDNVRKKASKIDVRPMCRLHDDGTAVVRVVVFTKWGGLIETVSTFNRELPHILVDSASKTLVEYDCGVRF